MEVVLRFVDKSGQVKERFLGMSHVTNTCAQSLKDAIDAIFSTHGLSVSTLRGQGYDESSNMSGEFNGLKALILRKNPHDMYVHCFAHQLQLAIVFVARRNCMLGGLFDILVIIVNLVGASCKCVDSLRTSYQANILEKLNIGELNGGSDQFQEMSLAHLGDTRWGSHLLTITRLINMFNAIIDVLENILEDGVHSDKKSSAIRQMNAMQDFEFVFSLYFMFKILAITNDLSQALQKKDQDIQNAIRHILVPNMEDIIVVKGRPRRVAHPRDSFATFDKNKLLRLAQFYPLNFNNEELLLLRPQLDKFLLLVRMDEVFFNLNSISSIAQKLVETGSSCYFSLVYKLLTLALILPVATTSVERAFFAMNLIESDLRNKMGDD
ncbi:zinc finger MYM-type protein 1-like [Olea europaea var. sylvestris]|uniref:zinc finger MYM-type protein 1-like n=1 Tax=Olea europaea var. sylvestris TaxID=158386 RepID=UPI000C1CD7D9|nr:zinc finger MYM-type protein 1-like [Olea europaea var. sylvestris]